MAGLLSPGRGSGYPSLPHPISCPARNSKPTSWSFLGTWPLLGPYMASRAWQIQHWAIGTGATTQDYPQGREGREESPGEAYVEMSGELGSGFTELKGARG